MGFGRHRNATGELRRDPLAGFFQDRDDFRLNTLELGPVVDRFVKWESKADPPKLVTLFVFRDVASVLQRGIGILQLLADVGLQDGRANRSALLRRWAGQKRACGKYSANQIGGPEMVVDIANQSKPIDGIGHRIRWELDDDFRIDRRADVFFKPSVVRPDAAVLREHSRDVD